MMGRAVEPQKLVVKIWPDAIQICCHLCYKVV